MQKGRTSLWGASPKIKYDYIERLFAPSPGLGSRSFFMPKIKWANLNDWRFLLWAKLYMPLRSRKTVATATSGRTVRKAAPWAKINVTIWLLYHPSRKANVTVALMVETILVSAGVPSRSCVMWGFADMGELQYINLKSMKGWWRWSHGSTDTSRPKAARNANTISPAGSIASVITRSVPTTSGIALSVVYLWARNTFQRKRWWTWVTFDYFYGQQADLFSFYRVPKILFTDDRFWNVSTDAKLLYGILLDRMNLSAKTAGLMNKGVFISSSR